MEAASRARRSPLHFDLTVSFSKSISIFHASLGENARLARLAGDRDGAAYWDGVVGEMDDMIWAAVRAGFAYFRREPGYTRTGLRPRLQVPGPDHLGPGSRMGSRTMTPPFNRQAHGPPPRRGPHASEQSPTRPWTA
jgi:hypothetical protein